MMQNSQSILIQNVKSTELMISALPMPTSSQSQAAIDDYLSNGYTIYDITSTSSSPGFSRLLTTATSSTAILCLFKTAYPNGFYELLSTQINTLEKDIIIMGCKVANTSAGTISNSSDIGLNVWFTQYNYSSSKHNEINVKFENMNFNYNNISGIAGYTGLEFNKVTLNNRYKNIYNMELLLNSQLNAYQQTEINCTNNSNLLINNSQLYINGYEIISSYSDLWGIIADGEYIYSASMSLTKNLYKFNKSDLSLVATLTLSDFINVRNMIIVKNYLYCGEPINIITTNKKIAKIDLNSFTETASLDISQNVDCFATDGNYLYSGEVGTNNIKRVLLSNFSTISTLGISQKTNTMTVTGGYLYCGANNSTIIKKITISDFTTIQNLNLGTGNYCDKMCTDGIYLYVIYSTNLKRILLSDFTTIETLTAKDSSTNLLTDGVYIYSVNITPYIHVYNISTFSFEKTITVSNNVERIYLDGDWIYCNEITNQPQSLLKVYNNNQNYIANIKQLDKLNDSIITTTSNYKYLNADITIQYEINYSILGKTNRNYYNVQFDAKYPIYDELKKFNPNRFWLWKREDVESILCPTSSQQKRIIDNQIIETTSTGSYDYISLPVDENFLLRSVSTNNEIVYYLWYNEKIKNTIFSENDYESNVKYSITDAFQILEFEKINDLKNNVPNLTNSPLSGSLLMNNYDNEIII